MKKMLLSFAAGMVLALTLLKIAENLTYTANTFAFVAAGCAIVTAAMIIGIAMDRIEDAIMLNRAAEQTAEPAKPEQTDEPVEVPRILAKHEKKPATEIEEVEPIPEMLEVGNDYVKRADQ